MKSLLVMRHAKSSWKDTDLVDHERPLSKRGLKDAPQVGKLLRQEKLIPELILSSSARRARDSAEAAADASGYTPEIRHLPTLYQCELETFYETLRLLPADVNRVLIVGHNPELEQFVLALTGETVALPTASLVHILLPVELWSEVKEDTRGALEKIWIPNKSG